MPDTLADTALTLFRPQPGRPLSASDLVFSVDVTASVPLLRVPWNSRESPVVRKRPVHRGSDGPSTPPPGAGVAALERSLVRIQQLIRGILETAARPMTTRALARATGHSPKNSEFHTAMARLKKAGVIFAPRSYQYWLTTRSAELPADFGKDASGTSSKPRLARRRVRRGTLELLPCDHSPAKSAAGESV